MTYTAEVGRHGKSDLFDVLTVFNGDYIAFTREDRVRAAEASIFALLNDRQKDFISFVLKKSIQTGVYELDQEKLPILLTNKYQSLEDAKKPWRCINYQTIIYRISAISVWSASGIDYNFN